MQDRILTPARTAAGLLALLGALVSCAPSGSRPDPPARLAGSPLHLEEHLASARVEGSAVPKDLPAAVTWRFDGSPQPAGLPPWRAFPPLLPGAAPAAVDTVDGALRVTVGEAQRQRRGLRGWIFVDLPGVWNRQDWAFLRVRARAQADAGLAVCFNRRESPGETAYENDPCLLRGESVRLIADGPAHDYLIRADWINGGEEGESAPWRQLGFALDSQAPLQLDLLEVSAVPKEARYADRPVDVHTEPRRDVYRRALSVHTPARLEYQVEVPEKGRLDFGLGVLRRDVPVRFRVRVADRGESRAVFNETSANPEEWRQRSIDLSRWAGRTVRLVLETDSPRAGTAAFWAAPTVSGARGEGERRPNVILYVIDAGNAELMSAYGYPRRTTPNLERLAAEGALFERAYSNSTWSKPSTTSFMTSLQHAVLGGYENPADPLPEGAPTMAELLHRAGWQTAVLTSNTWCGTMSSLDRGVDEMRETLPGPPSASSEGLQAEFWRWREGSPGEPYWTHFQTTDVHWPWTAVPPVAGAFLSHAEREAFYEMERRLGAASGTSGRFWGLRAGAAAFEKAGIDRDAYFDGVRGAYDEALLHNDLQLGRLVERLKATGEWEHTILIVTADHGDWPGLGLLPPEDPAARLPMFNPYLTHVPLVVVWPERIRPGQRFREPVSLLDLLPTVLDLAGQPKPEHLMGQSLAPLLLGEKGWEPRPVVLEEVSVDRATRHLEGTIEMVDGRWGASLAVGPVRGAHPGPRLLLYDLWNDPYCRRSIHDERPELTRKYTGLLETAFRDHLRRGKAFRRAAEQTVDSRQLETLRSLGYIN